MVRPDDVVLHAAAAARACLQSLLAEDMGGVKEIQDEAVEQSTVQSISRIAEEDGGGRGVGRKRERVQSRGIKVRRRASASACRNV